MGLADILEAEDLRLTAARQRDLPHGPVANRLWQHIEDQAATFAVMS